jgi:hypothetical protein
MLTTLGLLIGLAGVGATVVIFVVQWRSMHDTILRGLAFPLIRQALRLRDAVDQGEDDSALRVHIRELLMEYDALAVCYRGSYGDNVYARLLRGSHTAAKQAAQRQDADVQATARDLARITLTTWS